VIILLVCTEGEQMEECDNTASPNDNSAPENVSEVDPNFSLLVHSYSDSCNSNSSSLYEVNICVLNGKQNVELTIKREFEVKHIKQKEKNH